VIGLRRISERRRLGLYGRLSGERSGPGRRIAFVLLAVCAQIATTGSCCVGIGAIASVLDDRPADRNAHTRPAPDRTQPRHRRGGADPRGPRRPRTGGGRCAADRHGHGWLPLLRRWAYPDRLLAGQACRQFRTQQVSGPSSSRSLGRRSSTCPAFSK
jgi:hypothetical protein